MPIMIFISIKIHSWCLQKKNRKTNNFEGEIFIRFPLQLSVLTFVVIPERVSLLFGGAVDVGGVDVRRDLVQLLSWT